MAIVPVKKLSIGGVVIGQTNDVGKISGSSLALTGAAAVGSLAATGGITTSGASGGIGYTSGGAVVQATNKSTAVTLNQYSGQITMSNAAMAAGAESNFVLNNSKISANDQIEVEMKSGGTAGSYLFGVTAVSAGLCTITVSNISSSSRSEALVLQFTVKKGAIA